MPLRICLTLVFVILLGTPAAAQQKSKSFPSRLAASVHKFAASIRLKKRKRPPEAYAMVMDLLRGRGMGPGRGWFHPGESRFTWLSLIEKYDKDADFRLTRNEFPLNTRRLRRLDRNRDGSLTRADFDFTMASPINRQMQMPRMWFYRTDNDSNGKITRDEWNKLFNELSDKKPFLTPEDLLGLMQRPRRRAPVRTRPSRPQRPPTPLTLLVGVFNGELGALTEGPDINQMAPDFKLKTQRDDRVVQLSKFRGKKPVVLIFGSFT